MKARRSAAPSTSAPVPADPRAADVLSGRYRLGARIGSGGMADVYEGFDTRLRRPVAVKVFRPGPAPRTGNRLADEAHFLARLQHPGLVTVYDTGRHDDRTYLVMQLVDGPTLRGLLAGGALPRRRVADLGTALATALAHVHRAGIVHRDVKPSNVLLDGAGAPHLADFGIARLADATRHTSSDVLTGTAAYLAPEQVEGRPIGTAADIYALGLVLLECLKGELEYQGTPLEAAIARLHRPPAIPARVPPDLAALLRAMTAQDPAARPDARQCAQALSALNTAREPSPAPLPAGPAGRPPAPGAAHPDADEPPGTQETAGTRPDPRGGARHNRRRAVGTTLAALSVALGTTLAVASGTSGGSDDHAEAAPSTAPPPSSTATPASRPSAVPSTASRAEPASRKYTPSRPVAAPTGSHTEPVSETPDSSGRAPAGHHGTGPRKPAPHHPSWNTESRTRRAPHGVAKPPGKANRPKPPQHRTWKDHD
ncbi:protein kinase [Streptomyces sp. NPDC015220]|uniref:serine/threonine-protein kinase n=1 Tax=Streptomyces sp. NPDC015220 TaxID=3364947 RepID=UPI0036FBEC14